MFRFPDYEDRDPKGWCGDPKRGAALGRPSLKGDRAYAGTILIVPVPLTGAYDSLGTYWGISDPLWFYDSNGGEIQIVTRGKTRRDVVREIHKAYPNATVLPENVPGIEDFFAAYVNAALGYTQEDMSDGASERTFLENERGPSDIHEKSLAAMREDCVAFFKANAADIGENLVQAGNDFWCDRCGLGVGFEDRRCRDRAAAKRLHAAARAFGNIDLYIGDDGVIYTAGCEPGREG